MMQLVKMTDRTHINQRLLPGFPDDGVKREEFRFDQGWDGVTASQDSLHLLWQNFSNLQQHVFGKNIPGKNTHLLSSSSSPSKVQCLNPLTSFLKVQRSISNDDHYIYIYSFNSFSLPIQILFLELPPLSFISINLKRVSLTLTSFFVIVCSTPNNTQNCFNKLLTQGSHPALVQPCPSTGRVLAGQTSVWS